MLYCSIFVICLSNKYEPAVAMYWHVCDRSSTAIITYRGKSCHYGSRTISCVILDEGDRLRIEWDRVL